jgi:sterol desaturase/sphingolipid hydroxylase (fatty acid hydroxylase superfamily)
MPPRPSARCSQRLSWVIAADVADHSFARSWLSASAVFLLLLGFPPEAMLINNFVRHYWGHFIHADLPWTFGPLGRVIVSPAMHRWHHAIDAAAHGTNFATVFSLFDRLFGTYRVPGPCPGPLGVDADMGRGIAGQLAYPLRPASYAPPAAATIASKALFSEPRPG